MAHLGQLCIHRLQPLPLLPGHPVHLLVHQPHQVADVALGENVVPNLFDDHPLELPGVEPGGVAGPAALLEQGLADVVGELAALGLLAGEGLAAGPALHDAAEQVGTGGAAGVGVDRRPRLQQGDDAVEDIPGHQGGKGVLHPDRRGLVLGVGAPDHRSGVDLVGEELVDGGLAPALPVGAADALPVQGLGDVQEGLAGIGHLEHAAHQDGLGVVDLQPGALLDPVLDHDPVVAVGGAAGNPEASRCRLPHSPHDLLGQLTSYPINTKN